MVLELRPAMESSSVTSLRCKFGHSFKLPGLSFFLRHVKILMIMSVS